MTGIPQPNTQTAAEIATEEAKEKSIKDIFIGFSGRMLVKTAFEGLTFSDTDDIRSRTQYIAPEFNVWGRFLARIAANGLKDENHALAMRRMIAMNRAVRDNSQPISIFDKHGKVS